MRSIHQGIHYKCDKCDHEATQPSSLKAHIKSMHAETGMKFPCKICNYRGTSRSALRHHVDDVHRNNDQYQCHYCDFQTKQLESLPRHIRSLHDKVRYKCQHCDMKGTRPDRLRKHIQTNHQDIALNDNFNFIDWFRKHP